MEWSAIGSLIWEKLFGSHKRASELNKQTEIVINGYRELYEQKKVEIESYRHKHPGNGEELDKWLKREHDLMLRLVENEKEILFWKERTIFIEKENELLLMKLEKIK